MVLHQAIMQLIFLHPTGLSSLLPLAPHVEGAPQEVTTHLETSSLTVAERKTFGRQEKHESCRIIHKKGISRVEHLVHFAQVLGCLQQNQLEDLNQKIALLGACLNSSVTSVCERKTTLVTDTMLGTFLFLHCYYLFPQTSSDDLPATLTIRSITRSYYRNSVGGFLVFDITNRRSFEHVKDWLEEAKMHVQPFRIVFLLVGHKCDLASQRQVTREEAEKLSADCGMKYIETSAKDATNVEESFTILTRDIYELIKKGEICIQDGWEGVKSGFVPNTVHSSEEAAKPRKECFC
ncbi:hypothetical protein P7K49_020771 [Saguinus oedipus]|uniref:Ras-related protein Rab-39A n=1 Tax=Saguinus oedipus TaxID=9490 RepID=A0ABQ9UQR4_SAGOE|nr:hypothetical protein P7K49_020771 [Saguinus oedipus]